MAKTTRPVLLERWQRLDPPERALLQVLAVADEPLNQTVLLGLCIRAGLARHDPATGKPPASLSPRLRRLRDAGLIGADNRMWRTDRRGGGPRPVRRHRDPDHPGRRSAGAVGAARRQQGRQTAAAKALPTPRCALPGHRCRGPQRTCRAERRAPSLGRDKATACHRTRRELRLALVGGEDRDLDLLIDTLRRRPASRALQRPGDRPGQQSLRPGLVRQPARPRARPCANPPPPHPPSTRWSPTRNPWPSACGRSCAPPCRRTNGWMLYHLALRLILAGRTGEEGKKAQSWWMRLSALTGGYTFGFGGWIALVEGRLAAALDLFAADLKELRRRQRKRTIFFTSHAAPFALLALREAGDAASLDKAASTSTRPCAPTGVLRSWTRPCMRSRPCSTTGRTPRARPGPPGPLCR